MIFIFGAAYQGMEEYAREALGANVFSYADEEKIDFSGDVVIGLEKFVLGCVRRSESAVERMGEMENEWSDKILIGLDFSCGLVPMEAEARAWREENGRLNSYLADKSNRTIRMFCGLPQVLK